MDDEITVLLVDDQELFREGVDRIRLKLNSA
jgi:DNA-binding NarL/FixJ family response regulator